MGKLNTLNSPSEIRTHSLQIRSELSDPLRYAVRWNFWERNYL